MKENKIIYIDYLRGLGILLIILAHVCKNPYIMQLRNFDVPLMVVISGYLAIESYKKFMNKDRSILKYYWKRTVRLLIPTWIFLTVFFLIIKIAFINKTYPYDTSQILRSFLLIDGIGYVWVIRVYLMCAYITPLILYFNEKIKNDRLKLLIGITIYIIYELFVYFKINKLNPLFEFIIAYIIPYGLIYSLGMISRKINYKRNTLISIIFLIIFIISFIIINSINGLFQSTQTMKYPPRIYYISYALFVTFLLLGILPKIKLKEIKVITFCSRASLWIYLWHILLLKITSPNILAINWLIRYLIVIIGSVTITYIQNKMVDLLEKKKINPNMLKVFRG